MTGTARRVRAALAAFGSLTLLGSLGACGGAVPDVPRLRIHNSGAVAAATQPVIDWVGEEPVAGTSFTYSIELDPNRPLLQIVRLVSVTKDE